MNMAYSFDGALTMKPSLVLSRDVKVRHRSDRAYLAGEHGFDLSPHLTGRRGLLTRPSLLFVLMSHVGSSVAPLWARMTAWRSGRLNSGA